MDHIEGNILYRESRENKIDKEKVTKEVYIIDGVGYKKTSAYCDEGKVWTMELAKDEELIVPETFKHTNNIYEHTLTNYNKSSMEFYFNQPINHIIKAVTIIKSGDKNQILNLVKSYDECGYGRFYEHKGEAAKHHYSLEVFKYLSDEVQNDKDFIAKILEIKPKIYLFLNEEVKKDEQILTVMVKNRALFEQVISNIRELDGCKEFVLRNVKSPLRYFPEYRKDSDFIAKYGDNKEDSINSKHKLWVCAIGDLETLAIVKMLREGAGNGTDIVISKKKGELSWELLEEDIKKKIEQAKSAGYDIYGIKLEGDYEGTTSINYICNYNSGRKSCIEQVAEILGIDLTIYEQFISANAKGYIPEMERLGEKYEINKADLNRMIDYIRSRDRKLQGVTVKDELQALRYDDCLDSIKKRYIKIDLQNSKYIAVLDRLYNKYDNIIIRCNNGKTVFYGEADLINEEQAENIEKWIIDDKHILIDISSNDKQIEKHIERKIKEQEEKQDGEPNRY